MEERAGHTPEPLRVLWRHRLFVAAVATAAGLWAFSASVGKPRVYAAHSRLLLGPVLPQAALTSLTTGMPNDAGPLGLEYQIDTQIEIIRSPVMGSRVVAALGIDVPYEQLAGSVNIRKITDELLEIKVYSVDPQLAARLSDAYADQYLEFRRESAKTAIKAISEDLRQRADALTKQIDAIDARLTGSDGAIAAGGTDAERLRDERTGLLAQQNSLRARYEDLRLNETTSSGGGQVIARATVPTVPVQPNPARDSAGGAVAGLIVAIGVVFLRERLESRVSGIDAAVYATGCPVLVSIPLGHRRDGGWPLVTLTAPNSPAAEAFRALRATLASQGLGGDVRRLLVVSTKQGEGASSVAANLAIVCAGAGIRVLLISADLRRPTLDAMFQVSDSVGVAAVLRGDATLPDIVTRPIGGLDNLLYAPSGTAADSPGDLIASPLLDTMLDAATELAEIVIVDSSPVGAGGDAAIVASRTDGALFVIRAEVTRQRAVERAVSHLRNAGGSPRWVVLNGVRRGTEGGGLGAYPAAPIRSVDGKAVRTPTSPSGLQGG